MTFRSTPAAAPGGLSGDRGSTGGRKPRRMESRWLQTPALLTLGTRQEESGVATALASVLTLLAVCFLPTTNPNKLCLSLRRLLRHHLIKLPKLRSAKAVEYRLTAYSLRVLQPKLWLPGLEACSRGGRDHFHLLACPPTLVVRKSTVPCAGGGRKHRAHPGQESVPSSSSPTRHLHSHSRDRTETGAGEGPGAGAQAQVGAGGLRQLRSPISCSTKVKM